MKKIFNILAIAIAMLSLQACLHEDNQVFDEKAAVRINESVDEVSKVLTSSPNGWLVQYYTGEDYSGSACNFLFRFTDEYAYISADYVAPDSVDHCKWSVKKDQGPVISLDTYAPILHSLSEPSAAAVDGYETDYEFVVQKLTTDTIYVKGKRWGNKMTFTRLQSSDWAGMISTWQEVAAGVSNAGKNFITKDSTNVLIDVNNGRLYVGDDGIGVPFVFTSEGIHLQSPVMIDGVLASDVSYTPGLPMGTMSVAGLGDLIPVIPPLSEQFANGIWYFRGGEESMSTRVAQYFGKAVEGSTSEGEMIMYLVMGNAGSGYGLNLQSGNYKGLLKYDTIILDDFNVSLKFLLSGDSNGVWYYNNAGYNYVVSILGGSAGKQWTIVDTDNEISPSWMKFQNPAREDEWFVVYASNVSNPFNM